MAAGKLKTLQYPSNQVREIHQFFLHLNAKDRLEGNSEDINYQ